MTVINGTGAVDTLKGSNSADTINGGAGADTMTGRKGHDVYLVDDAGDLAVEVDGQGKDTVISTAANYTLGANIENLVLDGTGNINAIGNNLNNLMTGNSGNNTLNGGSGFDILTGNAGNDTYVVDNALDMLYDTTGTDTVSSSVSWRLGALYENLILTGSAPINGTGNSMVNTITGNTGHNTLDGGAGNDTLIGGTGNDTYIISGLGDVLVEAASEGTDTVRSAFTYTLATDFENLTLTGTTAINGTGNSAVNTLTGNIAINTLTGGAGNDTYVVQNTGDVVVEVGGGGTDLVESSATFTLAAEVENLTLTGTAVIDGTGNAAVNTIIGNAAENTLIGLAGNDTLDGGGGADVLIGGADNDVYIVNDTFDVVIENFGEGTDTVEAGVTFTLQDNIENLSLTGTAAINAFGNSATNILTGNNGNNTLYGFGGDDTLAGGGGDDTFIVNSVGDVVSDATGNDTVVSTIDYTLGASIENLTLQGSADLDGTGNGAANTLTGNAGINTLTGGGGNDTYVVQNTGDVIVEVGGGGTLDNVLSTVSYTLSAEIENMTLLGTAAINATGNILNNSLTGNSARNTLTGGLGDDVYYVNLTTDRVVEETGEGNDLIRSTANTYTIRNHVETLQLDGIANINGNGNAQGNIIIGNIGNNIINAFGGDDTVTGDAGRDTISGGDGNDTLDGGDGVDSLDGGNGNDVLSGGSGADIMNGGADDDSYSVDSAGDVTIDSSGYDRVSSTVSYVLGVGIERLDLLTAGTNGTGNALDNVINADLGENRLDGKAGADTMSGGIGNDTYVVDNVLDEVIETSGYDGSVTSVFSFKEGRITYTITIHHAIDIIESSVSYSLANVALTNVEVLRLTGSANINATGNILDNILIGNSGTNTLTGGFGDDIYGYNNNSDVIVELTGQGEDTVFASISYTLGANLENINLNEGAGAINATGDNLDNVIQGNESVNILNGGGGNDYYEVTAGDIIIDSSGVDTVASFSSDWVLQAGLENLRLYKLENGVVVGNSVRGTGNSESNFMVGNNISNTLDGSTGADYMRGLQGNDTYIVDDFGDFVDESTDGGGTDTVISSVDFLLDSDLENLTLTGTVALLGMGNAGVNTMTGNNAASTLEGFAGADTYIVSHSGTVINESGVEIDNVFSSVSYILAASVENMTLTGTLAINGTGNSEVNTLVGNAGVNTLSGLDNADTLDGGAGADVLIGGLGSDIYLVDNTADTILELASEGTDLVKSRAVSYTLSAEVENMELVMGSGAIRGTGNDSDNYIIGNQNKNILIGGLGNDTLSGGTGIDTMDGGAGDDTYHVDAMLDVVIDTLGGIDTVNSSAISYTLKDGLENLTLISGAITGIGNAGVNTIIGTTGANTLNGNGGADTLNGGAGNDTYITDTDDVIIEGGGIDTIVIGTTHTLTADFENLTLSGVLAVDGTGNTLDNILTGNKMNNILTGLEGKDTLAGGLGIDTLLGGLGDDVYTVTDSRAVIVELVEEGDEDVINAAVNYIMGAGVHVETLNLTGKVANGTGNELDNIINGNAAANVLIGNDGHDTLDGKEGVDRMVGGLGDDIYYVNILRDVVTEFAGQGQDTVITIAQKYTLGANIEVLYLQDSDAFFRVGNGNTLDNTLHGGMGIDSLDGKAGADTMLGGAGDDYYFVDNAGDLIIEFGNEGVDTVSASVSHTIYSHVEGLVLTGTAAINGTGNSLNNIINGNTGANILSGMDGDDTLDGKTGIDTMIGGLGDDSFFVDHINDVVTELADEGTDTVNSTINYTLGATFENLTLLGRAVIGTGNALDNVLIGSFGANTLIGDLGDDTLDGNSGLDKLYGGLGNDTYIINAAGDQVFENVGEGIDTVKSAASYILRDNIENLTLISALKINGTGNALDNVIIGGTNDNIIDGKTGADTMSGGAGNDTYYVDNVDDVITETLNQGTTDKVISSVSYRLSAHVENLTLVAGVVALNGTGNDLKNIIIGNAGNNTLDGGLGADTMNGGAGNDTYYVDDVKDVVVDTGGIDIVYSSVTHVMSAGIESLVLTGFADANVTGNVLANTITGNEGNNSINGGGGVDTMAGGLGDDTYVLDVAGDVVIENASEGRDTIQSNLTYTLAANFENLTLLGKTAINGAGNSEDNTIIGNTAINTLVGDAGDDVMFGGAGNDVLQGGLDNDILYGQAGLDVLTGGAGADTFVFEVTTAYSGIDTITDFSTGSGDALDLRDVLFVYDPAMDTLEDFVRISDSTTNSTVEIDRDGLGTAFGWTQVAVLQGVTGLTDEALLVANGNLLV